MPDEGRAMAASLIIPSLLLVCCDKKVECDFVSAERRKQTIGCLQKCRDVQDIKQVHGQMVKMGLSYDSSAISKLISACAEMGSGESLEYAKKAFNLSLDEGIVSSSAWNSMIKGSSSAGRHEEAASFYLQMVIQGVSLDRFTFSFVINACSKVAAFKEGTQIHASLIKIGYRFGIYLYNSLIQFYCKCGEMDSARKLFDEMPDRNVVSWTTLISGYSHADQPEKALALFEQMKCAHNEGPNSITLACVVSACAKLRDLEGGEKAFRYVRDMKISLTPILFNSLVDMYMKCGDIQSAKQLFDKCEEKNLVLWNTMLSNYVRQAMPEKVLEVFYEMWQYGVKPDRVTLLAAISACSQLDQLACGKQCHCFVIRHGMISWDAVTNSIMDMYMKCEKPEMASRVFEAMNGKSVVSWNTLISGFVQSKNLDAASEVFNSMLEKDQFSWNILISALAQDSRFDEAINLFREMQNSGVNPDTVTMVSVASACGYLGSLELSRWVHAYINKNKVSCDVRLDTSLVDMYARCGDLESSMQVFRAMKKKDLSAWTAAIGAMAMEGNGLGAIELYNEMAEQGVEPDGITFVGLLTACSRGGLVKQGMQLFQLMSSKYGITPQLVHYGCMVDLLGRAGLIEEAKLLIQSMPEEPNDVIWGSLLAACRIHRNMDVAILAARKMIELAPDRSGLQVLLSNVFASAGKWGDVAKVRLNMKNKGIQKLPGSSSIQVNGSIHEFTSSDDYHPQRTQIAGMLDEIYRRLKHVGYISDLANVLLDVDEEEKEHLLSLHSEKLAMAYGLISTVRGSPLRIIKNLRMCTDCHSFAKLVSDIYSREIVIRDNNRFHFFRQGKCSCMDYW